MPRHKHRGKYEHTKKVLAPYDATLLKMSSMKALKYFEDDSLDFVYIDADHRFDPGGNPIGEEEWNRRRDEWLPSAQDKAYIESLQSEAVFEPGKMANWIAPPKRGIDGKPLDFEYVRTES